MIGMNDLLLLSGGIVSKRLLSLHSDSTSAPAAEPVPQVVLRNPAEYCSAVIVSLELSCFNTTFSGSTKCLHVWYEFSTDSCMCPSRTTHQRVGQSRIKQPIPWMPLQTLQFQKNCSNSYVIRKCHTIPSCLF